MMQCHGSMHSHLTVPESAWVPPPTLPKKKKKKLVGGLARTKFPLGASVRVHVSSSNADLDKTFTEEE